MLGKQAAGIDCAKGMEVPGCLESAVLGQISGSPSLEGGWEDGRPAANAADCAPHNAASRKADSVAPSSAQFVSNHFPAWKANESRTLPALSNYRAGRGNIPTAPPLQADRTLTAEIVHRRIDYRRKRPYRLGTIARPLDDSQLREARDLHLLALQEACGREDFGEIFEGRT